MAVSATWVWVREDRPLNPGSAARFAREHGVRDAWVSVPWGGPDERVLAMAAALRDNGLTVSALGGSPDWAEHPERAVSWAARAMVPRADVPGGPFSGIHLDIEPWTLPQWPGQAAQLLRGTATAVRRVAEVTGVPVDVDLAPHLARDHPGGFTEIAGAAGAVTLMSYRTTSAAILAAAAPAVGVLQGLGRPYRLAVDTLPPPDRDTTFAGRPTAYCHAVLEQVAGELTGDRHFRGVAVHDLRGWQDLR